MAKVFEIRKTQKTMTFTLEFCAWKWLDNPITLPMRSWIKMVISTQFLRAKTQQNGDESRAWESQLQQIKPGILSLRWCFPFQDKQVWNSKKDAYGAAKALINFFGEDYHYFTNPKNSERPFWGGTFWKFLKYKGGIDPHMVVRRFDPS